MKNIIKEIDSKKAELDRYRPLPKDLVQNLDEWFNIEIAYNSNAIEGNTLTKQETALVIKKGLTVGGKSVKEHLEAINHSFALDFVKDLASKKTSDIQLADILDIQRLILKGIDDSNAGRLRKIQVMIAGSDYELPSPIKVPDLVEEFIDWLQNNEDHPVKIAADAHFKLVAIHPFVDGNGRTARLLMNLILIQHGYPVTIIKKEDRRHGR